MEYIKGRLDFHVAEPTVLSIGKFDGLHRGHELLMDYDCFISENMSCSSILDEVKKIGKNLGDDAVLDERRKEHIAHLKNVSIIRLSDFEKSI